MATANLGRRSNARSRRVTMVDTKRCSTIRLNLVVQTSGKSSCHGTDC